MSENDDGVDRLNIRERLRQVSFMRQVVSRSKAVEEEEEKEEAPESFRAALYLIEDLKKERDLLKLRLAWKEAEVAALKAAAEYTALNPEVPYSPVGVEVLEEADEAVGAADKKREEAKAAYLAAGGEE